MHAVNQSLILIRAILTLALILCAIHSYDLQDHGF